MDEARTRRSATRAAPMRNARVHPDNLGSVGIRRPITPTEIEDEAPPAEPVRSAPHMSGASVGCRVRERDAVAVPTARRFPTKCE